MSKRTRPISPSRTNQTKSKAKDSQAIELIARAVIVERSHVLLCRNVRNGYYFLPGGHVEFSESAGRALERELLEECGLASTAGGLLLVSEHIFARPPKPQAAKKTGRPGKPRACHEVNLVFHVEPRWPAAKRSKSSTKPAAPSLPAVTSRESKIAFDWVDLAALVDLDLRPTSIKAWLMGGAGGTDAGRPGAAWLSEDALAS